MFAIEVSSGRRRWITGVFARRESVDSYLALGLDPSTYTVIDLGDLDYPLYIAEDHTGFRFLSEATAVAELQRYAGELRQHADKWCYTNLYRVNGDWRPKHPGSDAMGILAHHHITNLILNWMEREGFEALWGGEREGAAED